jgi:catechol-2,3-dioxygenase
MPCIPPAKFAHVVYRTYRYQDMLAWYRQVFDASVQQDDGVLAFLTYDEEHHRFAFANLSVLMPQGDATAQRRPVGVDHVAYTHASVGDLLENYARLKAHGILPYWCVHHGVTASMYYADPDGNQMEFQVDAFRTSEAANDFMRSMLGVNPVGVEYDPEDWLRRHRAGAPAEEFLVRRAHEPMSPLRGYLGGLAPA